MQAPLLLPALHGHECGSGGESAPPTGASPPAVGLPGGGIAVKLCTKTSFQPYNPFRGRLSQCGLNTRAVSSRSLLKQTSCTTPSGFNVLCHNASERYPSKPTLSSSCNQLSVTSSTNLLTSLLQLTSSSAIRDGCSTVRYGFRSFGVKAEEIIQVPPTRRRRNWRVFAAMEQGVRRKRLPVNAKSSKSPCTKHKWNPSKASSCTPSFPSFPTHFCDHYQSRGSRG